MTDENFNAEEFIPWLVGATCFTAMLIGPPIGMKWLKKKRAQQSHQTDEGLPTGPLHGEFLIHCNN